MARWRPEATISSNSRSRSSGLLALGELVGPIGRCLGAEADGADLQVVVHERLGVSADQLGAHDHRVAAGEQHVGHRRVELEVGHQPVDLLAGELEVVELHELRPPEAIGAVGVAGLALGGEEQHRLPVLVLHALHHLFLQEPGVHLHLARGMGVEAELDLPGCGLDLGLGRFSLDQIGDAGEVLGVEHPLLGEGELEHRVVGHVVPVDQLFAHIVVGLKREHRAHHPGHHLLMLAQPVEAGCVLQVAELEGAKGVLVAVGGAHVGASPLTVALSCQCCWQWYQSLRQTSGVPGLPP